jgi:peptide/nickel transport system ATP-binding protein
LTATGITHRFGSTTVLQAVDFALAQGEVVGLVGPSGVGKSTLWRILAGHLRPDAGRVSVDGAPTAFRPGVPRAVQYAPQVSELSLDPRWRIERVLHNGGAPDPTALKLLGVRDEWRDRYPAELSGGELARVSLARLLPPTTRYLICDEITAPLDALSAEELVLALKGLADRWLGILLISHDRRLLERHAGKCFYIEDRALRPLDRRSV